jgi:hypothetical protein
MRLYPVEVTNLIQDILCPLHHLTYLFLTPHHSNLQNIYHLQHTTT